MNKLTRKLFISILTLALTFISLGASTFAWFTLNNKAEVEKFNASVAAGAGIEISLDGQKFVNTITSAEINAALKGSKGAMEGLTSMDGKTFQKLVIGQGLTNHTVASASSGFVYFDLFFRTPEPGISVFLLSNSTVDSTGISWIPDVGFTPTSGTPVVANSETILSKAANAIRFSAQSFTAKPLTGKAVLDAEVTTKIFEYSTATSATNTLLGSTIPTDSSNGMVSYFNAKYPEFKLIEKLTGTPQLPSNVLGSSNLVLSTDLGSAQEVGNVIVPLNSAFALTGQQTFYYGVVTMRFWLEGWDPDMFNAIMGDELSIYLNFGGAKQSEYTVTFDSNEATAGDPTPFTATFNGLVTEPAEPTKDALTFGGWYLDDTTFNDPWDFENDVVTNNVVLYAKWS